MSLVRVVIICLASTHTALVSSPSLAVLHLSTYQLPTSYLPACAVREAWDLKNSFVRRRPRPRRTQRARRRSTPAARNTSSRDNSRTKQQPSTTGAGGRARLLSVVSYYSSITSFVCEQGSHLNLSQTCLLYTSPSPRDATLSRMPSSA